MAVWSVPKLGTEMLETRNCFGQSMDCLCGLCHVCVLNCGLGVVRSENGHGFRFHKVEPRLGERVAHGQPTARLGTVKKVPVCLIRPKMSMCYLHNIA